MSQVTVLDMDSISAMWFHSSSSLPARMPALRLNQTNRKGMSIITTILLQRMALALNTPEWLLCH